MKNIFKIASLLAAAVMLFACEEDTPQNGDNTGDIVLVSDKDVIQSNGQDVATLKVLVDGQDKTSESVIYDQNNEVVELDGGKFTANKDGEYKFWATCGTLSTYNKEYEENGLITIKAISVPVPQATADPQPKNTTFAHRAFLTQYTGTGCGYCPYMIKILKELIADNTIPGKAVLAAVHSYGNQDPAYIPTPRVSNYPFLHIDLKTGFSHTNGASALYSQVNSSIASDAKAGISVNPSLVGKTLVVKVSVKAAVDGEFSVGAWLLEDGIYGMQSDYDNVGDDTYDHHENCVRIADSKYRGTYLGLPVGKLKKGETAEKTFVMNVKNAWKVENLHLAAFVSYGEPATSGCAVCNAVDVPIDQPTPFEYK